jgi:methylated-DNA-[protein]-cysteine S-methyltransferase
VRAPAVNNDVRIPPAATNAVEQNSLIMSYLYKLMQSPVGQLTLVGSERGLAAVLWEDENPSRVRLAPLQESPGHPLLIQAQQQLEEYFAGKRRTFSVKLDPSGTEFQNKVWSALRTIPFGETRSYGQIAEQIGSRKAVRAVGAANGRNPLSIIVPCHRVIGADGTLTGFAGGLEIKARLLALEAHA